MDIWVKIFADICQQQAVQEDLFPSSLVWMLRFAKKTVETQLI